MDNVAEFQNSLMFSEARESVERVLEQASMLSPLITEIAADLRQCPPRLIITCARGSSDHAATFAKYMFERWLGVPVCSASPSLSSVFFVQQKLDSALVLGISQSGRSPDLLSYVAMARSGGAKIASIVNVADSPLASAGDWLLPLAAGGEFSVAATKSYICTIAALIQLGAALTEAPELITSLAALPDALSKASETKWSALEDLLLDTRNCFIVGRGTGLAIAQEAALKLKETCGIHAEAISAAEIKHGPMALIAQDIPVIFLIHGDETAASQLQLADEFRSCGGRVLVAGSAAIGADLVIDIEAPPSAMAAALILAFYLTAARLAPQRGIDPDIPPLLSKITETR